MQPQTRKLPRPSSNKCTTGRYHSTMTS
jgi:hypothetical protein